MPNFELFIKGNVPSSKNGKQIVFKKSKTDGGKIPIMIWSKAAKLYVKETKAYYEEFAHTFRNEYEKYLSLGNLPMEVHFLFVRGSKHKFDYPNPLQTVLDLMVHYKWMPDDNADIILPVFDEYKYDKDNPGVYIKFKGY